MNDGDFDSTALKLRYGIGEDAVTRWDRGSAEPGCDVFLLYGLEKGEVGAVST